MTPSFLASFIAFCLAGVGALFSLPPELIKSDPVLVAVVMAAVVCNALYFYFLNALAEYCDDFQCSPPSLFQLVLALIQYTTVYTMWYWLRVSWHHFGGALLFIYFTYLLWDSLHWRDIYEDKRKWVMLGFDALGLVLASLVIVATWTLPAFGDEISIAEVHHSYAIIGAAGLVILQSLAGIVTNAILWRYFPHKLISYNAASN